MKPILPDTDYASEEYLERKANYLRHVAELSFEGVDWTAENIRAVRDFLGPWEHNIRLPHDIYTTDWAGSYPDHEEIAQVLNHHLGAEFTGKDILDLGCLEGYFTFECALQGASVVGVDGKLVNVKKCEFVKSVLGAEGVKIVQDDAMAVTRATYGAFDVVLVLGLLYHLPDPFTFLANMAELCRGFMVIDTHVSLVDQPETIKDGWRVGLSELQEFSFDETTYLGRLYREFGPDTAQVEKDLSSTAALRNDFSLWLTDDSLLALLRDVGFAEVDQVMFPKAHGTRWSDIRKNCRVLLVAFKDRPPFTSQVL